MSRGIKRIRETFGNPVHRRNATDISYEYPKHIRFQSLAGYRNKSIEVTSFAYTITQASGRKVHYWESNNVRGFEGTWTETVWDGKLLGGRYASPGVYYYNIVGEGRDGTRRRAHGFFHLFREK